MAIEVLHLAIAWLAAFALLLLVALLLARVLRDRLLNRRCRQREEISKALLATVLDGYSRALAPYSGKDLLVAETAQVLADVVRGPELKRMKTALAAFGLGPQLVRRLKGGRKRQKMVAAEALALLPGAETVRALTRARDDPSSEVRLATMFSLLDLGEAPSIREALETAGSGDWRRSLLVTELLRRLGRDDQAQLAEEIERAEDEPSVQVMLLEAVDDAGDLELLSSVAARAEDEDPAVRAAAVSALGRLAVPDIQKEVGRALDDADAEVRHNAVVAAHRASLHRLAVDLGRRLDDPDWGVRHATILALRDLGPGGREVLRRAAATSGAERRREIELAKGELTSC